MTARHWYLPIGALELVFMEETLRHCVTGANQWHSITAKKNRDLN